MRDEHRRGQLEPAMKRALIIIKAEQPVIHGRGFWRGTSGNPISQRTIEALFTRYLIKIVTESRHRKRHTTTLTDVGLRVARDLEREMRSNEKIDSPFGVTEEASLFIAAVVG